MGFSPYTKMLPNFPWILPLSDELSHSNCPVNLLTLKRDFDANPDLLKLGRSSRLGRCWRLFQGDFISTAWPAQEIILGNNIPHLNPLPVLELVLTGLGLGPAASRLSARLGKGKWKKSRSSSELGRILKAELSSGTTERDNCW